MKKVILKGPRVTLRPIKLSDASQYVRWLNDPSIVRYLLAQQGITLAAEKKYIRNVLKKDSRDNNFAIFDEKGVHIGSTSLDDLDGVHKKAVFGIVIGDKKSWGKGYAGECIQLLANYLFKKLKYHRLELKVAARHTPAVLAYKKAGFKVEGLLRHHEWNKVTKRFEDNYIMSILQKDWLKNNP